MKVFVSCTPRGTINFISKVWGGRASDINSVKGSGFVGSNLHRPGDQILADRGFTLQKDFAVVGYAHLITPAFTRQTLL